MECKAKTIIMQTRALLPKLTNSLELRVHMLGAASTSKRRSTLNAGVGKIFVINMDKPQRYPDLE